MLKINNENIHDPAFYWDYIVKNPHAIRKKVAIVYAGRSGSMMLSGLLDGHSHLLSFNCYCDAKLYNHLKQYADQNAISVHLFKEYIRNNYQDIMDEFYKHKLLPNEIKKNQLDINSFMNAVNDICDHVTDDQLNLDLMINIAFIAYGKSLNRPLNTTNPVIILQIHSPFLMDDWKYIFQHLNNLNLIVMVRNPLKAIDSHFYHHTYETLSPPWHNFYERIILEYKKSFLPFLDKDMQNKSYCMFFEDIHAHTEKTMKALCLHLNIPFENILLEETMQGQKAVFPTAGTAVNGASKERGGNNSLRILGCIDVYLIEYLFKDLIQDLGYPLQSSFVKRAISAYFLTQSERLFRKKEMAELLDRQTVNNQDEMSEQKKIIKRESRLSHRRILDLRIRKNITPYKLNMIKPD